MTTESYELHEEIRRVVRDLLAHIERLTLIVGQLENEKRRMSEELDFVRRELERYETEELHLSADAGQLEEENRRLAGRYGILEEKIRSLVRLDGSVPADTEPSEE